MTLDEQLELLSLIGDVATQDEKPVVRAHVDPESGLALIKP